MYFGLLFGFIFSKEKITSTANIFVTSLTGTFSVPYLHFYFHSPSIMINSTHYPCLYFSINKIRTPIRRYFPVTKFLIMNNREEYIVLQAVLSSCKAIHGSQSISIKFNSITAKQKNKKTSYSKVLSCSTLQSE